MRQTIRHLGRALGLIALAVLVITAGPALADTQLTGSTADMTGLTLRLTDQICSPADGPITFIGTVDPSTLADGDSFMIGLVDKAYVDSGESDWYGGAYVYFARLGDWLRIGPSDGMYPPGEVVQVFTTLLDYFSGAMEPIQIALTIYQGQILVSVDGGATLADDYGVVKAANDPDAYLHDEFAMGAYIAVDRYPETVVAAYDLAVTGCRADEGGDYPNQGQCISSRIADNCQGLTGRDRAECNKEQIDYCHALFHGGTADEDDGGEADTASTKPDKEKKK